MVTMDALSYVGIGSALVSMLAVVTACLRKGCSSEPRDER